MLDFVKKTYLLGLGLASLTREKVEEVVDDLIKRGEISEKDRREAMENLLSRAKEEQQRLGRTVKDQVQKVTNELGLVRQKELESILSRIESLEKLAASLGESKAQNASSSQDG